MTNIFGGDKKKSHPTNSTIIDVVPVDCVLYAICVKPRLVVPFRDSNLCHTHTHNTKPKTIRLVKKTHFAVVGIFRYFDRHWPSVAVFSSCGMCVSTESF